ncbi:MAG: ferritin-like domain-containing protein [Acidimicrobiales bacterium]
MSFDDRALLGLIEESQDLQSDAMRTTRQPLAELVELGQERRARGGVDPDEAAVFAVDRRRLMRASLVAGGALAAYGFGGALLGMMEAPAFADQALDVQMLQTSASIENLAVATYTKALTLDFVGGAGAGATVKAFVSKTRDQHAEHGAAFNDAVSKLGGKPQADPDPVLASMVNKADLSSLPKVVDLAISLEQGAASTYQNNVAALNDANAKKITASIMGVEAQHVSILLAAKALVEANRPDLVTLDPANVANLPDAAGKVGFPESFQKTDQARSMAEGSTK